jgi:hypothetical protein
VTVVHLLRFLTACSKSSPCLASNVDFMIVNL